MAENTQVDVKKLSFERAIEELESIVKRLEDGKVPLEESVAIYERGEALKRRCEELLRQAEARVDKITTDASGQVDRHRAARRAMTPGIGTQWPHAALKPWLAKIARKPSSPAGAATAADLPAKSEPSARPSAVEPFALARGIWLRRCRLPAGWL